MFTVCVQRQSVPPIRPEQCNQFTWYIIPLVYLKDSQSTRSCHRNNDRGRTLTMFTVCVQNPASATLTNSASFVPAAAIAVCVCSAS